MQSDIKVTMSASNMNVNNRPRDNIVINSNISMLIFSYMLYITLYYIYYILSIL